MKRPVRVHVFGASGSGTSTLGAALAGHLCVPHLDVDDFYWKKTEPPYRVKVPPPERVRAIRAAICDDDEWVLSGSIVSWGGPLLPTLTQAVFLELDAPLRMARLRARERERYGARIEPGGDMQAAHDAFMEWAARYDTASGGQRCRPVHLSWMARLDCPVTTLDAARPVEALLQQLVAAST